MSKRKKQVVVVDPDSELGKFFEKLEEFRCDEENAKQEMQMCLDELKEAQRDLKSSIYYLQSASKHYWKLRALRKQYERLQPKEA